MVVVYPSFNHLGKWHAACPLAAALSRCYSAIYTQMGHQKTMLLDRKWEYTSHDRTRPGPASAGTLHPLASNCKSRKSPNPRSPKSHHPAARTTDERYT